MVSSLLPETEPDDSSADIRSALIVLAVIAVMVLANLVDFPATERRASWISVAGRFSTPSLTALGRKHSSISILSSPYLMIAETAPGATIILPNDHPFGIDNLYGLSRATAVNVRAYRADQILTTSDLIANVIDSQHDDNAGRPWTLSIAAAGEQPETLAAIQRDGDWYLVDTDLLTDEARNAIGL